MKSQAEILKLERLNVLFKGFDGGNAVRTLKHRLKYLYERKQGK